MNTAADVAASRPLIQLELHAYPTIRIHGQRVDLPLKGGLALIARLAAEPDRLSRAAAAESLWPDADAGLGRGRLRRLMHDVNRRLGVDLIAGDADTLWLDVTRQELRCDWSDARRIARLALQAAALSPEEAAPLLRRDSHRLLEGFGLESECFTDWLDASRREQAALVVQALERLAARWLADDRVTAALAAGERLVRIDPLAEAGYVVLMAARARRGDAGGIAAAYFECAENLRHELGVPPSAAFERGHAEAMAECARVADHTALTSISSRIRKREWKRAILAPWPGSKERMPSAAAPGWCATVPITRSPATPSAFVPGSTAERGTRANSTSTRPGSPPPPRSTPSFRTTSRRPTGTTHPDNGTGILRFAQDDGNALARRRHFQRRVHIRSSELSPPAWARTVRRRASR